MGLDLDPTGESIATLSAAGECMISHVDSGSCRFRWEPDDQMGWKTDNPIGRETSLYPKRFLNFSDSLVQLSRRNSLLFP